MAWGSHSEKEMIIGKVIFEISRKNDVHNNYETDYRMIYNIKNHNITCIKSETMPSAGRSNEKHVVLWVRSM